MDVVADEEELTQQMHAAWAAYESAYAEAITLRDTATALYDEWVARAIARLVQ